MEKPTISDNVTPIGKAKKPKKQKKPNITDPQIEAASQYFIPLGHMENHLYFMTTRGKHVLCFSSAQLGSKANLFMLAPLAWWERQYNADEGFKGSAVDNAVSWVISLCYDKGAFTPRKIRGRGAWWDNGKPVMHLGDHLLVDGESVELLGLESENVYEAGPAMSVDISEQADDEESIKLIELCNMLHWENPVYGTLAAGWLVSALVCGALEWRPHLMTTGPTGCGKSWVAKHIYEHVLGDFLLSAKGETTEAGLRQELKNDSIAVTFDEAEAESQKAIESMNKVLGLMRQASAEAGGHILKGGADGHAAKYTIRSAFHLFAIRVPLQQTADENRVTVLTLLKNTEAEQEAFKRTVKPLSKALEDSDWADRVRARVFANIRTLRHNAEIFADAMSEMYSSRIGDQYGPLLGGAWLLGTTDPISKEKAAEKVKDLDRLFEDIRDVHEDSDEEKLISSIMAPSIKVPGEKRTVERNVGELISIAAGAEDRSEVWKNDAAGALERVGIKVVGDVVMVSNRHDGLKKLLAPTPWGVGWSHILRRVEGAKVPPSAVRFAGRRGRAVGVPLGAFI